MVTGGTGFVGSHLVDALLARGAEVVAVDNYVTGSPANVAHLADEPRFTLVEADVSEELPVEGHVDAVLHFASPASPVDFARIPIEILRVGSQGTQNCLELAEAHGARFLFASTSEVYGDPQVHPQPESYWGNVNPVGPRSVYDEAKRYGEALTMAYHRFRGVDTAIVRIFNTYGPRMRPDDGRAIPNFIAQALRGEPITLYGDGSQTRSICYVSDLVAGILLLLDSGRTGPMNCGTEHEMSMRELAETIRRLVGSSSELVSEPLPENDPLQRRPVLDVIRGELGYEPVVTPADGLARTIADVAERIGAPLHAG
ncbi:MAG TPA: UDP-glucuronic acid decarboxylase family protein [Mycobacteriales bacterium]|nr:UDP-glucuronic acid decarboxylase family protein [Mycobacteriales bacterium]